MESDQNLPDKEINLVLVIVAFVAAISEYHLCFLKQEENQRRFHFVFLKQEEIQWWSKNTPKSR